MRATAVALVEHDILRFVSNAARVRAIGPISVGASLVRLEQARFDRDAPAFTAAFHLSFRTDAIAVDRRTAEVLAITSPASDAEPSTKPTIAPAVSTR
jgi:hypothetical protein